MAALVEYIHEDSPVHRLNALTKIFWALFTLGFGLLFNDYRYLLALLASVLLVAASARVLQSLLPVISGLTVFAMILFLIQALFYNQGQVLFYLIPGVDRVPVTVQGLLSGLAMAARMMTIILSFLVFLTATRTQDIVLTLVEKFKIPYDYAFMFLTALRFIPSFLNEVKMVSDAQQARGHSIGGINPFKKIKSYAPVTIPLVLLSINKAENIAMAMETRGYCGGNRTCLRDTRMGRTDYLLTAALILLLASSATARAAGYGVM